METWRPRQDAGLTPPARGAAAAPAPRRPALGHGALLAALPLALAALDHGWLFDGPSRDPWIYYGYFRFTRMYLEQVWFLYYSSRLSVILPGYCLFHLLPAVPANLLLHFGLYAAAIAAFYASTKVYSGRRGALFASLVLGSQPLFLTAVGSNYVPGFGLTYYLLALALVVAAARRPEGRAAAILLALAGAAAVALVAANLFYAVYLPFLLAHFLVLNHFGARQRLLHAARWTAAGGAAAFVAFDAVGWFWGHGSKLFLKPTITWLWDFSRHESIYKHPIASWGPRAGWLVFPLIVLGGSLAVLARRAWRQPARPQLERPTGPQAEQPVGPQVEQPAGPRAEQPTRPPAEQPADLPPEETDGGRGPRIFAQLQYLGFFALLAAIELEPHGVTLEYFYYAVLLLPPACLALACQVAPLLERLAPRVFGGLAVGVAAVLAPLGVALVRPWAAGRIPTIALPLAAGAVAVAVLAGGWRGLRPAVLVAAALGASVLLTNNLSQHDRHDGYDDSYRFFRQIDAALDRLQAADPSLQLRLWYSLDEEDWAFYDSLACSWRLCYRLVNYRFPSVGNGRMCGGLPFRAGVRIAVLSQRPPPAAAAAAERSLRALGVRVRWLGAETLAAPIRPVSLLLMEIATVETPARPR